MKGLLVAAALILSIPVAAEKPPRTAFPNSAFSLPVVKGMSLDWVLPPEEQSDQERRAVEEASFDVDRSGNPWFADGRRRYVSSPRQNLFFRTAGQFQSFLFAGGKDPVACDDHYLSALRVSKAAKEQGRPVMESVALLKLDHGDCRLFAGQGEKFYLALRDDQGRDEVWSVDAAPKSSPRLRRLIRVSGGRVTALAGDGDTIFYGVGKAIFKFKAGEAAPALYFDLPEEIRGLGYSTSTGLFYATAAHVGFLSPGFQMNFVSSPEPRIVFRNTDLFIRLSQTFAVVKVTRADLFKTLSATGKPAPAGDKKAVH